MADPKPKIKSRVKVQILPSSDAQEEVELDYRQLVTGDFSKSDRGSHKDGESLHQRRVREIKNKRDFQSVLKELNPKMKMFVADKLSGKEDAELEINLDVKSMKDFHPDQIAENVEPLQKLLAARERMKQLKMQVLRDPKYKKILEKVLTSDGQPEVIDNLLAKLAPPESKDKKKEE